MKAATEWVAKFEQRGAAPAAPQWSWSDKIGCHLEKDKKRPAPGYRSVLTVGCHDRHCPRAVARVEVPNGDIRRPVLVAWLEGGQTGVTGNSPRRETDLIAEGPWAGHRVPRMTLGFWVGRFPLVLPTGERAPGELRFDLSCVNHGPTEFTAADLFAAVADGTPRIFGRGIQHT